MYKAMHNPPLLLAALLGLALLAGCQDDQPMYELEEVKARQAAGSKERLKTETEFFSILYIDLFDEAIGQATLQEQNKLYLGIGDKQVATELIIRTYLNDPQVQLPPPSALESNPAQFIADTYQKLYLRQPTEYEKRFWADFLAEHPEVSVRQVYYAFLTADEYKFY